MSNEMWQFDGNNIVVVSPRHDDDMVSFRLGGEALTFLLDNFTGKKFDVVTTGSVVYSYKNARIVAMMQDAMQPQLYYIELEFDTVSKMEIK